ncbi:bifunctional diguanylate cyclase/phosphodiesterase [Dactylosporangium sp. NBC_01737]|uniref:putative bifunctional diguanylate cyclase/phosphodiesterase n=1 Tax=Dactylosporangium sp. NBC_01737 TaxID=2975959 RepID=UPI002E12758D|nr:bifunctional diguanylate cyclase/phosphodiesterase [Dactylosporangium sp. NBC_01737]
MTRQVTWAYALCALTLAVGYVLLPAAGLLCFAGLVLSTLAAMMYGVVRHRPRHRLSWLLWAAGSLMLAIGTATAVVQTDVLQSTAYPSIVDAVSLGTTFPLLLLGLLRLSRSGAVNRDWVTVIDSLIFTAGAGLLAWVFLIDPYLGDPGLNTAQKAVSIAYPLCDVLLLSIMVRMALSARRSWSVALLLTSGAVLLVSDVVFSLRRLNGDWGLGSFVDLGWILFFATGGLAALHPSMVQLTEPRVIGTTELKPRRAALGIASLVAPGILFAEALSGPVRNGLVISVGSAALVALSLSRVWLAARSVGHALTRERELRRACEALLSATDVVAVERVVKQAVSALLRSGTAHRTVLVVHPPGAVPAAEDRDPSMSMRYVAQLKGGRAGLARELDGFELALHCPLSIGGVRLGELWVAAHERALITLQESGRVLAGQAASMIDHIVLNREITRRDSEAYFRTLVLNAADVILIVGEDDRVTYASPSARPLLGAIINGRPVTDLLRPADVDDQADFADPTAVAGRPHLISRPDGSTAEVEVTVRDLTAEPTVAGRVLTLHDVTERRRLERELLDRAYLDPLTGLGNRLRFQDHVHIALAGDDSVAVLLVDIDGFRTVNDTMGQDVGDELLQAFARRLVEVCPRPATVTRLGADEFGVLIAPADVAGIEELAQRIVDEFRPPFVVGGSVVSAQPSIGIALAADVADVAQLLGEADVALDSAKGTGERWRRYESAMHADTMRRMRLRADLDQALADDAFVLHYQPIVDLGTGRPHGCEALVRWQHPSLGLVPPLEFIEIAEECGLIVPLGDWVMRNAIAAAVKFRQLYPQHAQTMSVNVSVRQFRSPGFVQRVLTELAQARLPADALTVEITESLLLGDDEHIHTDLATLRSAGVRISIDDFGTGYSSLSYLHRVPVDALKLDKSFVDTIGTSRRQHDLVNGIVQLAHTLDLDVVAEGIEVAAHRELLADLGCGYGQGYLFTRPLPYAEVLTWLQTTFSALSPVKDPVL